MFSQRPDWLHRVSLLVITFLAPLCRAIHFTTPDWSDIRPGSLVHLTWADQVKWATITLMKGRPEASEPGWEDLVISNSQELQLDWRVPTNLPDDNYFLQIYDLSGNTNFSPVFRLQASVSATLVGSVTATGSLGPQVTATSFQDGVFSSVEAGPGTVTTSGSIQTSQPTDTIFDSGSTTSFPSSDISNGAKAGIAIGAIVGIIGLLGFVSFFFYRRGKQVGASRGTTDGDGGDTAGLWGRHQRNRLHSSDGSDLEAGKFRAPTPTPKELSGENKLPPELGTEGGPIEIGTDWPVVAELSTGELCVEEMETACGEIKLDKMSKLGKRMSTLKPLNMGGGEGEKRAGGLPVSPLTPSKGEKPAAVSPLTPCPIDVDRVDVVEVGHDKRESRAMEIQIQLKDKDDGSDSTRKDGAPV